MSHTRHQMHPGTRGQNPLLSGTTPAEHFPLLITSMKIVDGPGPQIGGQR